MRPLAEGVWQIQGFPRNAINVYVIGAVLIDAGTRRAKGRILRQLGEHVLSAHALTHAHPDHQGASHAICERLEIPLWCGERDVAAMETAGEIRRLQGSGGVHAVTEKLWTGPPHPVARVLREGDLVADFTVLETPGHSAGHLSFWRETDRTLICGDVLTNMNLLTGRPGLHEPPPSLTRDITRNRASAQRLAALEPALACFGHGPPLRSPGKLAQFAATLPS